MRFHLTKIIEDRSPVTVTTALEKCLKYEAWEIKRHDRQMIALGIGASRSAVNMSDKAIFDIDYQEGVTTVQVEVEYQCTWFLSEESQNHTVHSRFESVFANVRVVLELPPENLIPQTQAEEPPALLSEPAPFSETSVPALESVLPQALDKGHPEPTQQAPVSDVESLSAASPIAHEPTKASKHFVGSSNVTPRPGFAPVSLLAVALIVVLFVVFGISHFKGRPISGTASKPVPSVQSAAHPSLPQPDSHPRPLVSLPAREVPPSVSVARSGVPSKDLGRWLEQWAAAERTRDAKSQASFYADDVRPYLALDHANRDAIYRDKQDSIDARRGLWTFKIEGVSIQTESADDASVLLKKIVMTQTNSVRVSEHRISSFLTLKRTPGGWLITGERNLL